MRTAILTDSNSGITVEEGKKRNIFVIPMPVIIDGESYCESVDFNQEKLYESLREKREISSSQPSPGTILDMWDEIFLQGYEEIVYIPMSSGLSGTCENAMQMSFDYEGRIQVVDNHRISVTLKQSVLDAKYFADCGHSAKQIKEELERAAFDSSIYVAVDNLEQLKKGGRITPVAAALGSALNIKPVLTIQDERLDAFAKGRSMKQCERKMIEAVQKDFETRFKDCEPDKISIDVAGTMVETERAEAWREAVQDAFPWVDVTYTPLSCSIACHVGIDAVGIGICKILR